MEIRAGTCSATRLRRALTAGLLALAVIGAAEQAATAAGRRVGATTNAGRPPGPSPAPRSPGAFLPDSAVLARVGDRTIDVRTFVQSYFDSDPRVRPRPDSLGRVEFLKTMIDHEVLATVARNAGIALDVEHRAMLREYANRVVTNALYQRMVLDSIQITDADVHQVYAQFQWELRLQHIQFSDNATAERVRRDLVARRVPWSVAVRRHSTAEDKDRDGDIGWRGRLGVDATMATEVFSLEPGRVSNVLTDPNGYQLVRVAERRPTTAPALESLREMIESQIQGKRAEERTRKVQLQLLSDLSVRYDEENCTWAARKFERPVSMSSRGGAPVLEINPNLPEFSPADTARNLARYRDGVVTVGALVRALEGMQAMLRPTLETPEAVKAEVDGIILEPVMAKLAHDRRMDQDPMAVRMIEKKRDEFLVEQLLRDSVEARVRVTPQMRRSYYENNQHDYFTDPSVRFAALFAGSKREADSLASLLRGGASAVELVRADSLAGRTRGSIQHRHQSEHGPYHKLLFEELRPGKLTVDGPDRDGDYVVIQLLEYRGGRQLAFAEAQDSVEASVSKLESQRLRQELIARHGRRLRIDTRLNLVMRIDFHPR